MAIGTKIGIQGENEYKNALAGIKSQLTVLNSEMKNTSSQFLGNEKSIEALTAKNKVFDSSLEEQKKMYATAQNAIKELTTAQEANRAKNQQLQGEHDKEKAKLDAMKNSTTATSAEIKAQEKVVAELGTELSKNGKEYDNNEKNINKWKVTSNNASTEINKLEHEIKQNEEAMKNGGATTSKYADNMTNLSGKTSKASETVGKLAKGFATGMAAIGTAAVAVGVGMFKMAESTAKIGKEININSQKLNMSKQGYQEWDYVLKKSGSSIEALQTPMNKLQKNFADASHGSKTAVGNFKALGISMDELKGKTPEQAFDLTISKLQEMPAGADRTAAAMKIFGKSASELGPLLNKSGADVDDLKKKAHELGLVMSDGQIDSAGKFNKAMGTIKDSMQGFKMQIGASLLPAFAEGTQAFLGFIQGTAGAEDQMKSAMDGIVKTITDIIPKVLDKGTQIVQALLQALIKALPGLTQAIVQAIPQLITAALNVITSLAQALSNMLPTLMPIIVKAIIDIVNALLQQLPTFIDVAIKIVLALVQGLIAALPQLIAALPQIIDTIINVLINSIPLLIEGAIQLFMALVKAIPVIIDALIKALPKIITAIINGLITGLPMLIKGSVQLFMALVKAIPQIIVALVKALPQIITAIVNGIRGGFSKVSSAAGGIFNKIWDAIKGLPAKMLTMGGDLVHGIWNGISNASKWVFDKITEFAKGITDKIKNFFGIKSPSTLFRDVIGKNLALGVGEGFTQNMARVIKDMQASLPTDFDMDLNTNVNSNLDSNLSNNSNNSSLAGVTVNQYISTPQYNYAEQQAEARRQLTQLAMTI